MGNGDSLSAFYLQPLELDATLFEYVFGAEEFGLILFQVVENEKHLKAIEKLYVEYFGKTNKELFNEEIYSLLGSSQ